MVNEKVPPDGGWRAYTVVFSSFLCNGLIFGFVNTYSVLYVRIRDTFIQSGVENASSKASLIGSLTIGTTFLLSMVSGMLSDRIGIRLTTFLGGFIASSSMLLSSFFTSNVNILFFTYGILFGIGASLAYIPSLTIIGHYFKKYIGIANGFVTVGSSIFSVAMPYILDYLLINVGLSQCLRYQAALLSLLMLCSLVFKQVYHSPMKKKTNENTEVSYFANFVNLSIWFDKRYILWVTVVPLALTGYFVPYVHIVKFMEKQFPKMDYKLPVTCIAITSGFGRLIFGYISDRNKVNDIFLQQLSLFVIGTASILIPLTTNYILFLVLNLILGLFDGCFVTVIGPIAFKLCGPKGASQAIGFLLGFSSFPLIIGPPIAGWLYDQNQSYTLPFVLAGIPPIIGAILLTKIHFMSCNQTNLELVSDKTFLEQDRLADVVQSVPSGSESYATYLRVVKQYLKKME
ncbi:hypothetical protein PGB90_006421 [Kerria lacca]